MNRPTPKMHFVLVHGWGFNPVIWRDVIRNIGNAEVALIDLGFIAGGPKAVDIWPSDAIAVGHSLGLLWLLHQAGQEGTPPLRGLISIQGFDRFCPIFRRRGSPACAGGFAVTLANSRGLLARLRHGALRLPRGP